MPCSTVFWALLALVPWRPVKARHGRFSAVEVEEADCGCTLSKQTSASQSTPFMLQAHLCRRDCEQHCHGMCRAALKSSQLSSAHALCKLGSVGRTLLQWIKVKTLWNAEA